MREREKKKWTSKRYFGRILFLILNLNQSTFSTQYPMIYFSLRPPTPAPQWPTSQTVCPPCWPQRWRWAERQRWWAWPCRWPPWWGPGSARRPCFFSRTCRPEVDCSGRSRPGSPCGSTTGPAHKKCEEEKKKISTLSQYWQEVL